MGTVIDVTDLAKSYGETKAVDGVTLEVNEGEFFGILGPNGAGKTTTLELIEGLREADRGTISVLGESPWPRNASLLPRIGVQLQASAFFDRLTAREQLATFAALYEVDHEHVDAMLQTVGLTEKASTPTEKLSGGQRQRLSIACSLIHEPEVLFLDEPTAALDPQARRNLWDLLGSLTDSGRTMGLTTHYMDEAESLCDRVAVIDHGQILAIDSPQTLIRGLDAATRLSVVSGSLTPDDARRLDGVESVEDDGGSIVVTTRQPARVLTALAQRDALDGLQVRSVCRGRRSGRRRRHLRRCVRSRWAGVRRRRLWPATRPVTTTPAPCTASPKAPPDTPATPTASSAPDGPCTAPTSRRPPPRH
ncbi:MAG: ATP-binding cassette domain-containing protein [Nocardioidaceae bacterium]